MSEEFQKLFLELKKVPKGAESTPEYLKHVLRLFLVDFDACMSKRLDVLYWSRVKRLLDELRTASEDDALVVGNTRSLAVGFWTDLALLVHSHYRMPCHGLPRHLTDVDDEQKKREVGETKYAKVFLAYIMLRMGDLVRYKGEMERAREYYRLSSRINPADGAVWNQLGICAAASAQWVDAVYFHTRALHAPLDFPAATSSLTTIFKKFANRDTSKSMVKSEMFAACLAKIHFLMEIENAPTVLENLGECEQFSKQLIVSLLSIFSHLEGDTELENRSIGYVKTVWKSANRNILARIRTLSSSDSDELLHLLALLRTGFRGVTSSDDDEDVVNVVGSSEDVVIPDTNGFAFFRHANRLKYPLKRGALAEVLRRNADVVVANSEDVDDGDSESEDVDGEEADEMEGRKRSVWKYDDESDEEEEILMRGTRRGKAADANKSIDTDDDEFWSGI